MYTQSLSLIHTHLGHGTGVHGGGSQLHAVDNALPDLHRSFVRVVTGDRGIQLRAQHLQLEAAPAAQNRARSQAGHLPTHNIHICKYAQHAQA